MHFSTFLMNVWCSPFVALIPVFCLRSQENLNIVHKYNVVLYNQYFFVVFASFSKYGKYQCEWSCNSPKFQRRISVRMQWFWLRNICSNIFLIRFYYRPLNFQEKKCGTLWVYFFVSISEVESLLLEQHSRKPIIWKI